MIKKVKDFLYINDEFFVFPIIEKIKTKAEYRRLFSNFMSLSVLQAANYLFPLITFPYLVRVLGVEKFGLISFAQAFIQYFIIITDYGFNLSATREISIHRENKEKVNEIFSSVMIIKSGLFLISFIIMSGIVFGFEKFRKEWVLYYLTFGMVLGQVIFPVWFFQGMEQMKWITYLNIIAKGIFTVAVFVFVKNPSHYIYVPILNSMGFVISGVVSIYVIYKNFNYNIRFYGISVIKKIFKDSTQFFLSRVSVSVYTSSNAFVLGIFTNNVMVGYYSMAEKLYQALQYVYHPIIQTLYPYMSNTKNSGLFKKILKIFILINVFAVSLLFIFGDKLFVLLFSKESSFESLMVFRIFLCSAVVVVPSMMIGYPFLAAMGHPEYANKSVIYGSLVHIIMLVIFSMFDFINIYIVAIIVFITESFVFLLRIYYSKRVVYG